MTIASQLHIDPITLEVLRNALPAISDEMSYDLRRTSYNSMIYEVGDYCTALMVAEGGLLSQNGGGVSHFVADLGVVIRDGLERFGREGIEPGDVILMNHQKVAGQHLNNVVVYTPFFFEGALTAFPAVRAHWIDVGGLSTGVGSPNAHDPWAEGMQFDQIKLYEAGQLDQKLYDFIRTNMRFPEGAMGDLRSQIAACRLAERRLERLYQRYGRATIEAAVRAIAAETERKCRLAIEQIPDGVYEASSCIDHDDVEFDKPVELHAKVTVVGSDMTIDFSGCSKQRRGPVNSRTQAAAYVAYKALTTPMDPVNEGSFAALNVIIPEGNVMMAEFPAPMVNWSEIIPAVIDTVFLALSPALPDRIPAGNPGIMGPGSVYFGFDSRRKKRFVLPAGGGAHSGWGARPNEDGPSASANVCQGDVRNQPIEAIELKTPVIVRERTLRQDSGGAGEYRGGFGLTMHVECLEEGRWNLYKPRRQLVPAWGLQGGLPGTPGINFVKTPEDGEFRDVDLGLAWVPPGTVVIQNSAGGGGWGDPLDRDPERVLLDVLDGLVSLASARQDYGVILTGDGAQVDSQATQRLRTELRSQRSRMP